mmetsp:Transcript_14664/g.31137  ORF Transcript_14664/g.31137 Transcript_14664/m.31137 type:complete len:696 (-) Transcript_14664:81-2168(-)
MKWVSLGRKGKPPSTVAVTAAPAHMPLQKHEQNEQRKVKVSSPSTPVAYSGQGSVEETSNSYTSALALKQSYRSQLKPSLQPPTVHRNTQSTSPLGSSSFDNMANGPQQSLKSSSGSIHSAPVRSSPARSQNSESSHASIQRPSKEKSRDKGTTHNKGADNASLTSNRSTTSYTSLFSAYSKLKGYLHPKYHPSDSRRKETGSSPNKQDLTLTSGRKKTKYRSSNKSRERRVNSSSATCSTKSISPPVQRGSWPVNEERAKTRSPRTLVSLKLNEVELVEEGPSGIGVRSVSPSACDNDMSNAYSETDRPMERPSECSNAMETSIISSPNTVPSECNSVVTNQPSKIGLQSVNSNAIETSNNINPSACASVLTNEPPKMGASGAGSTINSSAEMSAKDLTKPPINASEVSSQVIDLPWMDDVSKGKLRGLYTGPVMIIPHGQGSLTLEGNKSFKFYGRWVKGELVSQLMNEEEKLSQECASLNLECASFNDFCKKYAKGYRKMSSNEYKAYKMRSSSVNSDHSNSRAYRSGLSRASSVNSDYSKFVISGLNRSESQDSLSTKIPPGTNEDELSRLSQHQQKYGLGQIARSPRDMIIHRSNDEAIHSASLLKIHERAFLKRSNGAWTSALLADRSFQPVNTPSTRNHWYTQDDIDHETMKLEESMLFVINEDGATKIIKKKYWGKFIRRIQQDGDM